MRRDPVSRVFGFDRGLPIDRYYIERFLDSHAPDIRGQVLEIGDDQYTRRFGGDRVTRSDVLCPSHGNGATLVGDLVTGQGVPPGRFDSIILTQTLHLIYEVKSVLNTVHQALAPGGAVLATLPGISQISQYDMKRWGDFWRFTTLSTRRLFSEVFGDANVQVCAFGNVYAACALLQGLCVADLNPRDLDPVDPDYEVIITVRAARQRQPIRTP